MAELLHITERATWLEASRAGEFRMRTRGGTLGDQRFIRCSLRATNSAAWPVYLYSATDGLVVLIIGSARLGSSVRDGGSGPQS